jgi:hypothetical protein
MANGVGIEFKEKMWGYYEEGLFDPWRVKERTLDDTFVMLENLPRGIRFPDSIKDKICYDPGNKHLFFKGIMTEEHRDELLACSQDKQYREAIEKLREGFLKTRYVEFDLTIKIKNHAAFIEDPENRPAKLEGRVHYNGWQEIENGEDNKFKLFTRDPVTDVRRLEYEIPFSSEGQKYFLYGYKEVSDEPLRLDLLEIIQDITTLFITIYKDSPNGQMMGTGILEFHLVELPVFLSTLKATSWHPRRNRRARLELLRHVIDNLRDSYSFLERGVPKEVVNDRLNELDQVWFSISSAQCVMGGIYNIIFGKLLPPRER